MAIIMTILAGLGFLAWVKRGTRNRVRSRWFDHLTGWQKLFGFVAVILAVVAILNPEFLVLGLAGDAAFFDVLVLGLTLQGWALTARVGRLFDTNLREAGRRLGIPSPGLAYVLTALAFAVRSAGAACHRLGERFLS